LKISFCTTVMNRLHHLQETLPKNLQDCASSGNVEFVILDYNSTDGLENWMKENSHAFGSKVVYYKTTEPTFYNRSHSRNMAFRLATGDVVCNLDADNYAGNGFVEHLTKIFQENNNILVAPKDESLSDTFGKISMTKQDFLQVKGYDEAIKGYGFEDNDIKNRLINLGRKEIGFEQTEFLKAISHTEEERVKNEFTYNHLHKLYVEKINHQKTKLVFVYKDSTYESAVVADSVFVETEKQDLFVKPLEVLHRYFIVEDSIEKGSFTAENLEKMIEIEQKNSIIPVINFYSQLTNKRRFMENFRNKRIIVNEESFGKGVVVKNFQYSNPIILS
jgi:glycosyltransferase involved in cell wall biosynthesis